MKIAIRVDSATMMGSGHVMRCLTLAERLRKAGAEVVFVCRNLLGNIAEVIEERGFEVHIILPSSYPETDTVDEFLNILKLHSEPDLENTREVLGHYGKFDWIIVDHYALDKRWESGVRSFTKKIFVIDDLANRIHDCDLLLDQNFYDNPSDRYKGLIPQQCNVLLGPEYLLLREEFQTVIKKAYIRNGQVKRILVFFGGSDPTRETEKTIVAIKKLNRPDIFFDIVVGNSNLHKDKIHKLCTELPNTQYYCQITNMAELMNKADLAIGAGGSTTWERCFLGLPALIIILAENQRQGIEQLATTGAVINLGYHNEITSDLLLEKIKNTIERPDMLRSMSSKGKELVGVNKWDHKEDIIVKHLLD
ncbi:UDP-2,4-diacetamido-2,4,6-trideoxy-beta-L-altropyranose hydrolase [Paenibacillus sp. GXUN7292]|uniref:UDP-2,4-diacetamido-2,4, 6-trideoxy-beta-L-altropyranose hydrolase n=1 Tax=Paenibacillus sp. GXUN7292 TaxID=3422499 RepID=UPI003D7EA0E8